MLNVINKEHAEELLEDQKKDAMARYNDYVRRSETVK